MLINIIKEAIPITFYLSILILCLLFWWIMAKNKGDGGGYA